MEHRKLRQLLSLATLILAMITLALFHANRVQAAQVSINGTSATNAVITDANDKTVAHTMQLPDWQTYTVSYNWSIPNDVTIASGDTATFQLPNNIAPVTDLSIPIEDNSGNSVGTFKIDKGASSGTLTFNQVFDTDTVDRQGTLKFYVNGTTADDSDNQFSVNKYGWISGYDSNNVPDQLTWNIALDSSGQKLTNVKLVDTLGDGQTFVDGSVIAATGHYTNGQFVSTGTINPKVTVSGKTITMSFDQIDSAVNLTYLVNVTPTDTTNGNSWGNSVAMTCDEGGGGTVSSSHKIEWGGLGTGNAEVGTGSVVLKNTNTQNGAPVADTEFSLYDASGNLLKSNLVTDTNGEITVPNLTVGSYYFVQTKVPSNFTLNPTKLSFTISPDKTTSVSIENTDPPATTPNETPTVVDPPEGSNGFESNLTTTADPVDPSDPSAAVQTRTTQTPIFIGEPILIGDSGPELTPVYHTYNNDPDDTEELIFPSQKSSKLPKTGNDSSDGILETIAGIIIMIILGSEYILWKSSH